MLQLLIIFLSAFYSLHGASAARVALQPHSYGINALAAMRRPGLQIQGKREVQTQWNSPAQASRPYRRLAYELLVEYANNRNRIAILGVSEQPGYNLVKPEIVLLLNRRPFCAGPVRIEKDIFRGIEYEEKVADEQWFGATRLIFFHEIKHLSEKDYYKSRKASDQQIVERDADIAAHIIGKCEVCSYEYAQYYFTRFKNKPKDYFLKMSAEEFDTLQKINIEIAKKMTISDLNKEYYKAQIASKQHEGTHPINIERALLAMLYIRSDAHGIAGSQCTFHKKYGAGLTTKEMMQRFLKDENTEQTAARNAEIEKQKAQAEEASRKKAAIEKEKAQAEAHQFIKPGSEFQPPQISPPAPAHIHRPVAPTMALRQPTGATPPSYTPVKNPLIVTPIIITRIEIAASQPPQTNAPTRQPAASAPIPTPAPTANPPIVTPQPTNPTPIAAQPPPKNMPTVPTNQSLPPIAIRQPSIAPARISAPIISPPIVYYGRPINQISTTAQKPRRKTTKPLETLQSTKIPLLNIVLGCGALFSTLGFSWYKNQ